MQREWSVLRNIADAGLSRNPKKKKKISARKAKKVEGYPVIVKYAEHEILLHCTEKARHAERSS